MATCQGHTVRVIADNTHAHIYNRREIGLEKFFKKSMIAALRKKNLRTMVLSAFQQYESLTMEGCIFQFFNLLSKHTHSLDTERFSNCAIGVSHCAMECICGCGNTHLVEASFPL